MATEESEFASGQGQKIFVTSKAPIPLGGPPSLPGGGHLPSREADHSPLFSAEVKNEWMSNSTPARSSWRGAYLFSDSQRPCHVSVAGLSERRPLFDPKSVRLGFLVAEVPLRLVFLRVLRTSPACFILPVLHTYAFGCHRSYRRLS
jgi:hypothetical protein